MKPREEVDYVDVSVQGRFLFGSVFDGLAQMVECVVALRQQREKWVDARFFLFHGNRRQVV